MEFNNNVMYDALLRRDGSFEGVFFAGIKTTGIFCRPTCTARKPKPENVEYFNSAREAMLNGYRPCKLCKPLESAGETPSFIREIMSEIEKNPLKKISDYEISRMNVEPNRVRRWFKLNHGITFQGYQRMLRINTAYQQLQNGSRVTDAAFDNGYDSLSGFADAYRSIIGDNPSGAKYSRVINIHRFTTPLGPMIACASEEGIYLVEFTDRKALEPELLDLRKKLKANIIHGYNKYFPVLEEQMNEYFKGRRKSFDLPLITPGTLFQNKVWKKLQSIPYGNTCSYKHIASETGNINSVRAVARANGSNRIAIIIPCHRVIGESGNLTGYSGGLSRKKWLIDFEKNHI